MVTFDGANKLILCNPGTVELDVKKLYSLWKHWMVQSDNAKYLDAFSIVGGNPILEDTFITAYYFLTNGWRVRPQEANHKLNVIGTLLTEDQSEVFVDTIGMFRITINSVLPIKSETTIVSGGTGVGSGLTSEEHTKLMSLTNQSGSGLTEDEKDKLLSLPSAADIVKELCEDKIIEGTVNEILYLSPGYVDPGYVGSGSVETYGLEGYTAPGYVGLPIGNYVEVGYVAPGFAQGSAPGSTGRYVEVGYATEGYIMEQIATQVVPSCLTKLVSKIWDHSDRTLTSAPGLTPTERAHLMSLDTSTPTGLKADERVKLFSLLNGLLADERTKLLSLYNGLKPDERTKLLGLVNYDGSDVLTPLDLKPLFDNNNVTIVEPE